jgi:predicted esterase
MATAHTIPATVHGRYVVEMAAGGRPAGLVVGFHGYGEAAEAQLARLQSVPGSDRWMLVSIQGLHRFYNRRSQEVVASWMTRQDRDLAIEDNVRYVTSVMERAIADAGVGAPMVFAGFSQGVAMAFRAACSSRALAAGVIAVGGDVPPELDRAALSRIPAVLLGKGAGDEWYSAEKWAADQNRLREAGTHVHATGFAGGHEWSAEVSAAAGQFLADLSRSSS